jgi:hypothetical protein
MPVLLWESNVILLVMAVMDLVILTVMPAPLVMSNKEINVRQLVIKITISAMMESACSVMLLAMDVPDLSIRNAPHAHLEKSYKVINAKLPAILKIIQ